MRRASYDTTASICGTGREDIKAYVGFDPRESVAYDVAVASLKRRSSIPIEVVPLRAEKLAAMGLLRRPVDKRTETYDLISNAPCATDFAISRFLVPHLAQTGFALFMDPDMVFLADVAELLKHASEKFAVHVVKHDHRPTSATKMDGVTQSKYPRKNWSSLILWNCDHPANNRLSLADVNERRGLDLHQFYWLHDSEIGSLPPDWNWLVGDQEKPDEPRVAHFTNGGPWLHNWAGAEHDRIWLDEHSRGEKW